MHKTKKVEEELLIATDYEAMEPIQRKIIDRHLEHFDFFMNDTCKHMKAFQELLKKANVYVKTSKYKEIQTKEETKSLFDSMKYKLKNMQVDIRNAENEIRNLRIFSDLEGPKFKKINANLPKKGYIVD